MSEKCSNCGEIGDACSCDKSVDVANEIAKHPDTALLDFALAGYLVINGNVIRTREDIRRAMEVGR